MIIYKDISGKIEPLVVEALEAVNNAAEHHRMPVFLVGAKARDVVFSAIFNIRTTRASLDVDLAVRTSSWDEMKILIDELAAGERFRPVNDTKSRFEFDRSLLIDVVPFGGLEKPEGKIRWPTGDHAEMSTIGFEEAFENSMIVRLRSDPPFDMRVCTAAAMVILKLVAWDEKYPQREKDAKDVLFIMQNYMDAGNFDRLSAEDSDLLEAEDFDYISAGTRMLGRDVAKIASVDTLQAIKAILERELADGSDFRLVVDMLRGAGDFDEKFQTARNLLRQVELGIEDT